MTPEPTPRTDEFESDLHWDGDEASPTGACLRLARKIERELAAAKERIEHLEGTLEVENVDKLEKQAEQVARLAGALVTLDMRLRDLGFETDGEMRGFIRKELAAYEGRVG